MHFIFDWSARVTDLIMIAAIILGPIAAVWVTIWGQARSERRSAKMRVFLTLLGERKRLVSAQGASALNTIDVVFADNRKVIDLWHQYYKLLDEPAREERAHTWLELLYAMGLDLRYSKLTQIDLDKFYLPQGHADEYEAQKKLITELTRVLENMERFLVEPRNHGTVDHALETLKYLSPPK